MRYWFPSSHRMLPVTFLVLSAFLHPLQAHSDSPSGNELIARINSRPLGVTEIRHARITLRKEGRIQDAYEVVTLRKQESNQASTLFLMRSPVPLRGTAFLLRESLAAGTPGCRIWLSLPTADHVLEIDSSFWADPLLGSDFTYQDWRLWLPVRDLRPGEVRKTSCRAGPCYRLNVWPANPTAAQQLNWIRANLYIDSKRWVLLKAEYFYHATPAPERIFEALDFQRVGNIWSPRRMTMTTTANSQQTTVGLLGVWYNQSIPAIFMDPRQLPFLSKPFDRMFKNLLGKHAL